MAEAVFDAEFILSRIAASKAGVEAAREKAHEKKIAELMKPRKGWFGGVRALTREEAIAYYNDEDGDGWPSDKRWTDSFFDTKIEQINAIELFCRQFLISGESYDGYPKNRNVILSAEEVAILDI